MHLSCMDCHTGIVCEVSMPYFATLVWVAGLLLNPAPRYPLPKDGVYPEKVNPGRKEVNAVFRRIGSNTNPAKVKFTGKVGLWTPRGSTVLGGRVCSWGSLALGLCGRTGGRAADLVRGVLFL